MRLQAITPNAPQQYRFDVLIAQSGGLAATGMTVRNSPTGGSEFQVVLLAEALAAAGYSVGVASPVFAFCLVNGVTYLPVHELHGRPDPYGVRHPSAAVSCDVLVCERTGGIPPGVSFNRIVFDLHDLPDPRLEYVIERMHEIDGAQVVVHSPFMQTLLSDWPRVSVIPCMVPDSFYGQPRPVKIVEKARNYVYGSAAMKGLEPTMALWRELKRTKNYPFKRATLTITSPGYDSFDPKLLEGAPDVRVYHGLSPAGMQVLLSASDGLFMVSSFPETFGIVMAQAEIAGVPAHVLQVHGQTDALHMTLANLTLFTEPAPFVASFGAELELLPARDYRISTHLPSWLSVLGLKQQEKAA